MLTYQKFGYAVFLLLISTIFSANSRSDDLFPSTRIKGGHSVYFDVSFGGLGVVYAWTNAFDVNARVFVKYSDDTSKYFTIKPGSTENVFGTAFDNYRTAKIEIVIGKKLTTCDIYKSKIYNWKINGWSADCQERNL